MICETATKIVVLIQALIFSVGSYARQFVRFQLLFSAIQVRLANLLDIGLATGQIMMADVLPVLMELIHVNDRNQPGDVTERTTDCGSAPHGVDCRPFVQAQSGLDSSWRAAGG